MTDAAVDDLLLSLDESNDTTAPISTDQVLSKHGLIHDVHPVDVDQHDDTAAMLHIDLNSPNSPKQPPTTIAQVQVMSTDDDSDYFRIATPVPAPLEASSSLLAEHTPTVPPRSPLQRPASSSSLHSTTLHTSSSKQNTSDGQPVWFEVSVSDPKRIPTDPKSIIPSSGYISYTVRTKTNLIAFNDNKQNAEVARRYSDFVWLRDALLQRFPGSILPPLPEKTAISRFQPEIVQHRRFHLENFMKRLLKHPYAKKAPEVSFFLESQAFEDEVKERKRMEASIHSRSAQTLFSSVFGNVLDAASGSKFTETDATIKEFMHHLEDLEEDIRSLKKIAEAVTQQRRGNAVVLFLYTFCS